MEDKIKAVPCDEIKLDPVVVVRGRDGKDGIDGRDGKDGVDGRDGLDGKDGLNGKDGKDGKDAVAGSGICLVPDYNEKTGELTFKEGNPKDVVKKKFKLKREETYIKRGGMTVVNGDRNVDDVKDIDGNSLVVDKIATVLSAEIVRW